MNEFIIYYYLVNNKSINLPSLRVYWIHPQQAKISIQKLNTDWFIQIIDDTIFFREDSKLEDVYNKYNKLKCLEKENFVLNKKLNNIKNILTK